MAREVILKLWCDPCMAAGVREEGVEQVIGIGEDVDRPERIKPKVLTVCETHEKEFVTPLREMLEEFGQPLPSGDGSPAMLPGGASRSAGVVITDETQYCKLCQPNKPLKNKSSLASHVRQYHEMYMHEYRAEVGEPQSVRAPKPGEEALFDRIETCEIEVDGQPCGKTYTGRYAPQQIGVHKAKKHGIKGPKAKPARA